MAADIMLLANTIVYDGQLRCGADHVADAVLDLQVAPTQISHPKWLNQVSSSCHQRSFAVRYPVKPELMAFRACLCIISGDSEGEPCYCDKHAAS